MDKMMSGWPIRDWESSLEDARKMDGEQIMAMKASKPAPYTEKLLFTDYCRRRIRPRSTA